MLIIFSLTSIVCSFEAKTFLGHHRHRRKSELSVLAIFSAAVVVVVVLGFSIYFLAFLCSNNFEIFKTPAQTDRRTHKHKTVKLIRMNA